MNADLHMADDLKNTGKGNLFVISPNPGSIGMAARRAFSFSRYRPDPAQVTERISIQAPLGLS
jgi:hypothetical protein